MIKEIKKIRLNKRNIWYFYEFLKISYYDRPIESNILRKKLLHILRNRGKNDDKDNLKTLNKLNDTLFTYSFQFANQFNIIETRLDNFILPNNFTKLILDEKNLIFSDDNKSIFQKIILYSDYQNQWRILKFIADNNKTLKEIINYLLFKFDITNEITKKKYFTAIKVLIQFYNGYELLLFQNNTYVLNQKKLEDLKRISIWENYDSLNEKFNWNIFLDIYNMLCEKINSTRISIWFIFSELSLLQNTTIQNLIKIFQGLPLKISDYNIYLIQGRTTKSSVKISGTLYDSIEISKL